MLTEGGLLYFEDDGGGGLGGGVFGSKEISGFHQKQNMHEYFGVRVPRIQNGMQIGNNLVHK